MPSSFLAAAASPKAKIIVAFLSYAQHALFPSPPPRRKTPFLFLLLLLLCRPVNWILANWILVYVYRGEGEGIVSMLIIVWESFIFERKMIWIFDIFYGEGDSFFRFRSLWSSINLRKIFLFAIGNLRFSPLSKVSKRDIILFDILEISSGKGEGYF